MFPHRKHQEGKVSDFCWHKIDQVPTENFHNSSKHVYLLRTRKFDSETPAIRPSRGSYLFRTRKFESGKDGYLFRTRNTMSYGFPKNKLDENESDQRFSKSNGLSFFNNYNSFWLCRIMTRSPKGYLFRTVKSKMPRFHDGGFYLIRTWKLLWNDI